MIDPAKTAGRAQDGSDSLAKESKAGISVMAGLVLAANVLLYVVGSVDPDSTGGATASLAATIGAAIVGLYTAYKKRNT